MWFLCRNQRTTFQNWFYLPTLWDLGTKVRWAGLVANTFTYHVGTQAQFPLLQRLNMLRVAWEGEVSLPGPLAIFLQSHVPPH